MPQSIETQSDNEKLLAEIAAMFVTVLNLEMSVDDLEWDMPLFGENGIGLDSIDALEIALHVEHRYGVKFEASDEENETRFKSIRTLGTFIQSNRLR